MQVTLEKQGIDIRDQVPTGLEVLDPPTRAGDDTGRNYAEAIVTGYVSDPQEIDGREKIIVGYIESTDCKIKSGEMPKAEAAVLITASFMHRQVFADFVVQEGDNPGELNEAKHSEAREKIMSLLYERLFGSHD